MLLVFASTMLFLVGGLQLNIYADQIIATILVGDRPYGVAVNPSTNKIYVANSAESTISVIDGSTDSVITTIPAIHSPYGIGVNPDTNMIYLTNSGNQSISVIDGSTNTVVDTIKVDKVPVGVSVNQHTNMIYVANKGDQSLVVINGTDNTISFRIFSKYRPESVAVNPSTNLFYVTASDPWYARGIIGVFNGTDNSVIKTIYGGVAGGVDINPKTNTIYADLGSLVHVIDGDTNTVVEKISGSVSRTVAVNPNTNKIYVPYSGHDVVAIIDGSTNSVMTTIPVGDFPFGAAVNPTTNKIYVANTESDTVSVIDGNTTIPSPPKDLQAIPGNNNVTLSWTAPENNGGSPITGYKIERSDDNGSTWSMLVSNTNSTSTTHSDTGLSSETTYSYRVYAINKVGASGSSNTASATTTSVNAQTYIDDRFDSGLSGWEYFGAAGYAISHDTTTGIPAPSAHISGDAWHGSCSKHGMYKAVDISSYSNGPITLSLSFRASSGSSSSTITNAFVDIVNGDTGEVLVTEQLVAGGTTDTGWQYYSKDISSHIVGLNTLQINLYQTDCWQSSFNKNNWFDNISLVWEPASSTSLPSSPTGLSATAGDSKIFLSWNIPSSNGGSPVTSYNVYRSTTSGMETFLASAGNVTSYTDSTVTSNQTYFYHVTAVNSAGESAPSNESSATPTAPKTVPDAPTGLTATTISSSQTDLSWTAPNNDGGSPVTGYQIDRSTDNGTTWAVLVSNTNSTATTYSDTGLSPNTAYSYRVSAVNSEGTSQPSNTASATTLNQPRDENTIEFSSDGSFSGVVNATDTLIVHNGVTVTSNGITNYGNITNMGTISMYSNGTKIIDNHEIIINKGTIEYAVINNHQSANITTESDNTPFSHSFTLNNHGICHCKGNLIPGKINNYATGVIELSNYVRLAMTDLDNYGTVNNHAAFNQDSGSTIYNNGTFNNYASLVMHNNAGAEPIINGEGGTFNNFGGALVYNLSTASETRNNFDNHGIVNNDGSFINKNHIRNYDTFNNNGTVTNTNGGGAPRVTAVIWNYGIFNNNPEGTINNNNVIYNVCGATLNNSGTYNGNPPQERCEKPSLSEPSTPTGLTATAVSSSRIDLSWTAPSDDGGSAITGYQIDRSTDNGSTWSVLISNTNSTSTAHSDTGLMSSTSYTYRVSAINEIGTSPPSNTVSATTNAPPPPPPATATITVQSADVSGNAFEGIWVELSQDGAVIQTGFTPFTTTVDTNTQYTVFADNWQDITFDHWDDGSTNPARTFALTQDDTFTAFYNTGSTQQNNPPTAANDSAQTTMNNSVSINVLSNDSDPDGNALSVTSTSTPSNGGTVTNSDNTITYAPNQGFVGTDSFSYIISDGNGGSDTAVVTVTVSDTSNTPSIVSLTVQSADTSGNVFEGMWVEMWQNGAVIQTGFTPFTVQLDTNTQYMVDVSNWQDITFDHWDDGSTTSARTFSLTQDNTFTAFYQTGTTPSNSPPVASDDSAQTDANTPVTISVLSNDSDADGDMLSVTSTSSPSNGAATINSDNTITYAPNPDYSGSDSFTYTISDGIGGTDTALVSITIMSAAPPPSTTQAILTITSADMSGNDMTGMYAEIWDGSTLVQNGYTPLTHTIQTQKQYTIQVADWGDDTFDHWEDSSTVRERTISISQDTTATAFYKKTTSSGPIGLLGVS